MNPIRTLTILLSLALALSSALLTGCSTPAGAAAATAGGLLGIGIGAQLATHSSVEVQIDVYEPDASDANLFKVGHPLAIRKRIEAGPQNISPGSLTQVRDELTQTMDSLRNSAKELSDLVADAKKWQTPSPAFIDDLTNLLQLQNTALNAWSEFSNGVDTATDDGWPDSELQVAAGNLRVLKKDLRALARHNIGDGTLQLLRTQIVASFPDLPDDVKVSIGKAAAAYQPVPGTGAREQIVDFLNKIRSAVSSNADATKRINSLLTTLGAASADSNAVPTNKNAPNLQPVLSAIFFQVRIETLSESAITIVVNALTASVNLGPISNDVMQFLVSHRKIVSMITRDSEDDHWHSFSHCISQCGAGNNDTVFYMENMALPVLKSATFDPNAFLAADGSIYKQALAALGTLTGNTSKNSSPGTPPANPPGNPPAPGGGGAPPSGNSGNANDAHPAGVNNRRQSPPVSTVAFNRLDVAPVAPVSEALDSSASTGSTSSPPGVDGTSATTPGTSKTGDGPQSGTTKASADITAANAQIAAVKNAKLDALKQILAEQVKIKALPDQTKWGDQTSGPAAVKEVTDLLTTAATELRTAATSSGK